MRPPKNKVESVILHNSQDMKGRWIPTKFEINSWVTLQPDTTSAWGRDYARYGEDSPQSLYKAQIKEFEVLSDSPEVVSRVRVRHAYESRHLRLDPNVAQPRLRCNYLYPCFYEDWIDPASIVGVVVGLHVDIGEAIHHNRSHRELLKALVFFYKWIYVPPAGAQLYGSLEEIPLPGFSSRDWPLPDMSTSECFRAKMRADFCGAMKPNTGSRRSHVQWFMPVGVFVDLFATAPNRIKTASLFSFRNLKENVFADLMDDGWNQKVTVGADIIRCTVSLPSIVFRYHIARQTLYVNFNFTRERLLGQWVPLEQDEPVEMVALQCIVVDADPQITLTFNVGVDWPLSHLRQEVQITMGIEAPTEFTFYVSDRTTLDRKVNKRAEKNLTVQDVLPPKILRIRRLDHLTF